MSEIGLNTLVVGRTQTGKTYWTIREVADAERLIVYATKREETGYAGVYFDALAGGRETFLRMWDWSRRRTGRFRLVYRPRDIFDAGEFDAICRLAYAAGDVTLVGEEVMTYTTDRQIGPGFKTLLTAGATRGIRSYLLTQRPFKIPREITSQARRAVIFACHEAADVAYIRETFGTAAAAALDSLQQYQYVVWQESGAIEIGRA